MESSYMKQAVMVEPGKIEFRQVEKPSIQDHEILMQTKRIGVCGSDIHVFHGMHPYTSYPVVQGHEVSGIAVEVGQAVKGVAVGDKVTFTPQVVCGECYACRHGMYHVCEKLKVMGFQTGGAGQEYFVLPEWNVFKLPDDMTLEHAAMIEPVSVAVHAVRRGGDITGKKVLVLGAGTIGNLVAQVAKAFGAQAVMITDISDYKLKKAAACHIDFPINTAREDLDAAILRHFGPDRADLILECVGAQATATQAVECARKGTTVVIVGVFGEKPVVNLGFVQDRELNLVGTAMYQKTDYEAAIELVTSGKMHLDELVTHRFPFDDYLQAYHTIEQSHGEYMKVMIELD
jgi:L-iditol 2-dehydrogenase